jgi:general stress protein YciG
MTITSVRRGFAAMPPERRRAIASAGGKASQASGRANHFTPDTASDAGQLGGAALVATYGEGYMQEIGRRGGKKSGAARKPGAKPARLDAEGTAEPLTILTGRIHGPPSGEGTCFPGPGEFHIDTETGKRTALTERGSGS